MDHNYVLVAQVNLVRPLTIHGLFWGCSAHSCSLFEGENVAALFILNQKVGEIAEKELAYKVDAARVIKLGGGRWLVVDKLATLTK